MLDEELESYPLEMACHAGHRRWGIENKAFNELTQYYYPEHCYHHEPLAMLAQMSILMMGFVLFSAYPVLHSQQIRPEQMTRKQLAHDLDLALEEDLPWDLWFASGWRSAGAALSGRCSLTICRSTKERYTGRRGSVVLRQRGCR